MTHTKRNANFQMLLKRLIEKLRANTLDATEREQIAMLLTFNTTDSGCMVHAAEDEPVFVLRAKDPLAPLAVNYWCQQAKEQGLHAEEKIQDAAQAGLDMVEWRLKNIGG